MTRPLTQPIRGRPLPTELADALQAVRRVEQAAATTAQRSRATAATSRLLLAAVEAGWAITELAPALDLNRQAASKRVNAARRASGPATGIDVEPPGPTRPPERLAVLAQPLEQRQWLTTGEARDHAHVSRQTIYCWLRAGLLPNTDRRGGIYLLLKADLDRVTRSARYNGQGIRWKTVRETIDIAGA